MKTFRMTVTVTCTEKFFSESAQKLKNDILSGHLQRELKDGKKEGVEKVTATWEELK